MRQPLELVEASLVRPVLARPTGEAACAVTLFHKSLYVVSFFSSPRRQPCLAGHALSLAYKTPRTRRRPRPVETSTGTLGTPRPSRSDVLRLGQFLGGVGVFPLPGRPLVQLGGPLAAMQYKAILIGSLAPRLQVRPRVFAGHQGAIPKGAERTARPNACRTASLRCRPALPPTDNEVSGDKVVAGPVDNGLGVRVRPGAAVWPEAERLVNVLLDIARPSSALAIRQLSFAYFCCAMTNWDGIDLQQFFNFILDATPT